MPICSAKPMKTNMHIASKTERKNKKPTHIATNGGLPTKTIKKPMHIE